METLAPTDLTHAVATLHVAVVVLAILLALAVFIGVWVGSLLGRLLRATARLESKLDALLTDRTSGVAAEADRNLAVAAATWSALGRGLRGQGPGSVN